MIEINDKYIQFGKAKSLNDAIDICAAPMIEDNVITTEYTDKIKELIENEGCYIVLLEKIAFAHYNPKYGSNEIGLGILVLDEDIKCECQDVKVILLLSGKTSENHLKLLQYLSIKMREDHGNALLQAKTLEDIKSIFD